MTEADPAAAPAPFPSLSALRAEHLVQLKAWRVAESRDEHVIAAFRRAVMATGALLAHDNDREAAQDILEYWGAQLLSTSGGDALPDLDLEIEPYHPPPAAPRAPSDEGMEPAANETTEHEASKAREQIRLNALARQWRQSNRVGSYLLTGAALTRAASFRDSDPEIEEFVTASERRVALRKARRIRRIAVASVVVLSLIGIGFYMYRVAALGEQNALSQSANSGNRFSRASWNVVEFAKKYDPGQRILFDVALIDHPDNEQGKQLVDNLIAGLKPNALPQDEQVRATDALVGNLMRPSVDTLTPAGLRNLLAVLASIAPQQWSSMSPDHKLDGGWISTRAGARRALANLVGGPGAVSLEGDEVGWFNELRRNIGLEPAPSQDVFLRFNSSAMAGAADVGDGMKKLGWRLRDAQLATSPASSSQVRYGPPADKAAAEMLAADLSKCSYKLSEPRSDPAIKADTLEVSLAEPLAGDLGCVPKPSSAPTSPRP